MVFARYPPGKSPGLTSVGFPMPPIIFAVITLWRNVLSVALEAIESVAGLATALFGLLLYFLRTKPLANDNAPHENASLEEERIISSFAERIESGAAARALHDASANGRGNANTFWSATGQRRFVPAIISANVLNVRHRRILRSRHAPFRWLQQLPEPNDIARFLAGMPVPENSPSRRLTRDQHGKRIPLFSEASSPSSISVNSKSCTRGSH